jgi:hypothetical protein
LNTGKKLPLGGDFSQQHISPGGQVFFPEEAIRGLFDTIAKEVMGKLLAEAAKILCWIWR